MMNYPVLLYLTLRVRAVAGWETARRAKLISPAQKRWVADTQ